MSEMFGTPKYILGPRELCSRSKILKLYFAKQCIPMKNFLLFFNLRKNYNSILKNSGKYCPIQVLCIVLFTSLMVHVVLRYTQTQCECFHKKIRQINCKQTMNISGLNNIRIIVFSIPNKAHSPFRTNVDMSPSSPFNFKSN